MMTLSSSVRAVVAAVMLLAVAGVPSRSARAQAPGQLPMVDEALSQARRLFDALDYEAAVPALDRAIALMESSAEKDLAVRRSLAAALELRARSHFSLGAVDPARADFRRLLVLEPGHALPGGVSPRVVSLFQEIQKVTIGRIALALEPADAELTLDGNPLEAVAGGIPVTAGVHTLAARRLGYRPATETITVAAGGTLPVALTLERIAAVVGVVTVPPETDVYVDGAPRGTTVAGALPPQLADWPAKLNLPATAFSAPMMLVDLSTGTHIFSFRRACYVTAERQVTIDRPADFRLDPVQLERAVASVYVDSPVQGTQVFLDGAPRGQTPISLDDVCEGPHAVELRSAHGRYLQRINARAGDKITVQGTVRPAFAVVGVSGLPQGYRGPDLRVAAEQALGQVKTVTLFAPSDEVARQALAAESLSPGWLSFDRYRRPIGNAATAMTGSARREISERLGRALEAQGVAEITVVPGAAAGQVTVALLASGSSEPDVFELTLDSPQSASQVAAQIDQPMPLFRPTIGLVVIGVLDVEGAVVVRVDPKSVAEAAGIAAGDRIVSVGGAPAVDAAALGTALGRKKSGDTLPLEWIERSGARKSGEVVVALEPRLIAMNDQSLSFNTLAVSFAAQAASVQGPPNEGAVARLNLAVALMRLGSWSRALSEIERVTLPSGAGVSNGTVRYLLGLCLEAAGRVADATQAFQAAASSPESLLTEDGPSVAELATRKLAELAKRGRD